MKKRKTKKTRKRTLPQRVIMKRTLPQRVIKHKDRIVSPEWLELLLEQKAEHLVRTGMPIKKAEEEAIKSELGSTALKKFQEYKKRLPKNKKPNIREFLKTIKI